MAAFTFPPTSRPSLYLSLPAARFVAPASPDLRTELSQLARRWELPLDDQGLLDLLEVAQDPDDGWVAESPEILTYARLALAANEAVRRDCPLWLVGDGS